MAQQLIRTQRSDNNYTGGYAVTSSHAGRVDSVRVFETYAAALEYFAPHLATAYQLDRFEAAVETAVAFAERENLYGHDLQILADSYAAAVAKNTGVEFDDVRFCHKMSATGRAWQAAADRLTDAASARLRAVRLSAAAST